MKSLTYLNNVSETQVSFTDNRATDVIFDKFTKDYNFIVTQPTFSLIVAANIVEIINPDSANLRYKINISGDVTLDFGELPEGVALIQQETVYTLYGIDSVDDWNAVKSPTITLNEDFFGQVSYTVTFIYDTPEQANTTISYDVGTFVPQVLLDFVTTTDIVANADFSASAELVSFASCVLLPVEIPLLINSEMSADFEILQITDSFLLSIASVTASTSYSTFGRANLSTTATISCDADKVDFVTLPTGRAYSANIKNQLFPSGLDFTAGLVEETTIRFTPSDGYILDYSEFEKDKGYTVKEDVYNNAPLLDNLYYSPDYNATSNETLNVKIWYGDTSPVLIVDQDINLNYSATSVIQTRIQDFTSNVSDYELPFDEYLYGTGNFTVQGGGGGGGGDTGGGGASGDFEFASFDLTTIPTDSITDGNNQFLQMKGLNITVGSKGFGGSTVSNGTSGNSSVLEYYINASTTNTITANGGNGGEAPGGNGGSNSDYNGGLGFGATNTGGGGGAGSLGNGFNASLNAGVYTGGGGGAGYIRDGVYWGVGGNGGGTAGAGSYLETPGSGGGGGANSSGGIDGQNGRIRIEVEAK